ncbi:MAG: ClpXP protease specificity-enhancing factor SspB [Paracoccaceae bacterium]
MSRSIDYGNLMHDAMRGLIRDVLSGVAETDLPGAHHFFISFDTGHPDVEIADWLSDRFPDDMTIVMQHWFDDLAVDDEGFAVTLNFGNQPERMYIPFDAIRTFVDPSVEFGLRFKTRTAKTTKTRTTTRTADDAAADGTPAQKPKAEGPRKGGGKKDADVVSLDSFRK